MESGKPNDTAVLVCNHDIRRGSVVLSREAKCVTIEIVDTHYNEAGVVVGPPGDDNSLTL
jgi:hypothetical protein